MYEKLTKSGETENRTIHKKSQKSQAIEMPVQAKWKASDFRPVENIRSKEQKTSSDKKVIQRALAFDGAMNPIHQNIVRIRNNFTRIKWIIANNAYYANGEKNCVRTAQQYREQTDRQLYSGVLGNNKIWIYGRRVNDFSYYITGYVIRHAHDFIQGGNINVNGSYNLRLDNSSEPIERIVQQHNEPLEPAHYDNLPHYHSANLDYLSTTAQGLGQFRADWVIGQGIRVDRTQMALQKAADTLCNWVHGETGHHVFDIQDLARYIV